MNGNGATVLGGQEVVGVGRIEGPILVVEGATNVSYDEVVEIRDSRGNLRRGRVLEVGEDMAVIQVFAGSTGLSIDETRIRFLGETLPMPVAEEMLDRIFDGLGNPIDGGPHGRHSRGGAMRLASPISEIVFQMTAPITSAPPISA